MIVQATNLVSFVVRLCAGGGGYGSVKLEAVLQICQFFSGHEESWPSCYDNQQTNLIFLIFLQEYIALQI